MKTLLRSCFTVNNADLKDVFLRNYYQLAETGLGFDFKEDTLIWTFIRDFVSAHNHVPDIDTIRHHFERKHEDEVVNRIEMLVTISPKTHGDFLHWLEEKAQDRRQRLWAETLKDASVISTTGLEIREGKHTKFLQGPVDSARYVAEKSYDIVTPILSSRLSGEVTADGDDVKKEYERKESDPYSGIGMYTGLAQMDQVLAGSKIKELWIHAAFTSHLKSSFALNWVYNQSVWYHNDSLYFSLEMSYEKCRRSLYALHSMSSKFRKIRYDLGLQKDPESDVCLSCTKIEDAQLSAKEKEFFFDYVIPDFNDPANNYGKIHIEVGDPDKIEVSFIDIKSRAETLYSKTPFSLVVIDHVGLVASRRRYASTTESQNEVIRDCKRFSMNFNRGKGIATVCLFQISREGYRLALKRKDKTGQAGYDLTCLSYANEAERSGDIITTSWLDDELRAKNRALFQCLKGRSRGLFQPFYARIEWPCQRILTCFDTIEMLQHNDDPGAIDRILDELGE